MTKVTKRGVVVVDGREYAWEETAERYNTGYQMRTGGRSGDLYATKVNRQPVGQAYETMVSSVGSLMGDPTRTAQWAAHIGAVLEVFKTA